MLNLQSICILARTRHPALLPPLVRSLLLPLLRSGHHFRVRLTEPHADAFRVLQELVCAGVDAVFLGCERMLSAAGMQGHQGLLAD
jgi:hypothetical protein